MLRPAGIAGTAAAVVTALVLAAVAVALVESKPYRTPSSSMEPTLHCKRGTSPGCRGSTLDRVLAAKYLLWFRSPRRPRRLSHGSRQLRHFAAFHVPEARRRRARDVIEQRVLRGRGFVLVDGRRLAEPYVRAAERDSRTYPPTRLPPNSYFLLGDNRAASCDSRDFGAVPRSRIVAIVVATYWPPSRITIR
jgi:signal peptidase I